MSTKQLPPTGDRYLDITRICDKVSLRKSAVYQIIRDDPDFPPALTIGGGWRFSEKAVDAWFLRRASKPQANVGERLAAARAAKRAAAQAAQVSA